MKTKDWVITGALVLGSFYLASGLVKSFNSDGSFRDAISETATETGGSIGTAIGGTAGSVASGTVIGMIEGLLNYPQNWAEQYEDTIPIIDPISKWIAGYEEPKSITDFYDVSNYNWTTEYIDYLQLNPQPFDLGAVEFLVKRGGSVMDVENYIRATTDIPDNTYIDAGAYFTRWQY